MDHPRLSWEVNAIGNDRKTRIRCRGKSLSCSRHTQPCRPAIRKQEAITISSIFHTHSTILSFIHVIFLFAFISRHLHLSFSFHFCRFWSSALLCSVDVGGGCTGSSTPVWAIKSLFEWRIQAFLHNCFFDCGHACKVRESMSVAPRSMTVGW